MLLHRHAIDKDLKDNTKTVLTPGLDASVSVTRHHNRNVASCFYGKIVGPYEPKR